jgi:hypothetical protein
VYAYVERKCPPSSEAGHYLVASHLLQLGGSMLSMCCSSTIPYYYSNLLEANAWVVDILSHMSFRLSKANPKETVQVPCEGNNNPFPTKS